MITDTLIIVGAPRSGTTLLQRCLAVHPEIWHLRAESHGILEGPLHPGRRGYTSNRCDASDFSPSMGRELREEFEGNAINLSCLPGDWTGLLATRTVLGRAISRVVVPVLGRLSRMKKPSDIYFLEKTPKNSLRVPFLEVLFDSPMYLWIRRHPARTIDSLLAGWRALDRLGPISWERFGGAGYPIASKLNLADYDGKQWKFALVPGWQQLRGRRLADVAAWQYYQCNRIALSDMAEIPSERVKRLEFENLVGEAPEVVSDSLRWAGLTMEPVVEDFTEALPAVNTTRDKNEGDAPSGGREYRFPEEVRGAMRRLKPLQELSEELGYTLDLDVAIP